MGNCQPHFDSLAYDEEGELKKEATRLREFFIITDDGAVLLKKVYPQGMGRLLVYMLGKVVAKVMGRVPESSFTLGDLSLLTGLRGEPLDNFLAGNPHIVYVGHGTFRLNTLYPLRILDELQKLYTAEQE